VQFDALWLSNMAMETLQTFGYEGDRGDIFLPAFYKG
jgi:hypothetical protein